MKKINVLIPVLAAAAMLLCACGGAGTENGGVSGSSDAAVSDMVYDTDNPVVTMEIGGYGKIVMELYPDIAPNTVNNFISLVKKGYYNNNTIHRIIDGFVVQGGDPTGTGGGDPGYKIKGEFTANGFQNDLIHDYGILSMARAKSYDSAGAQFFICLSADRTAHLNGYYAAFGKVISGMDIVDKMAAEAVVTNNNGKLKNNLTIVKAAVDTKGKEYPEPEKIQ